jgi:hypothetical protein
MIDVSYHIDKLEHLRKWVYLMTCQKICVYNQLRIFEETGMLYNRIDFVAYTFNEYFRQNDNTTRASY